jgi:hypothetical protein
MDDAEGLDSSTSGEQPSVGLIPEEIHQQWRDFLDRIEQIDGHELQIDEDEAELPPGAISSDEEEELRIGDGDSGSMDDAEPVPQVGEVRIPNTEEVRGQLQKQLNA